MATDSQLLVIKSNSSIPLSLISSLINLCNRRSCRIKCTRWAASSQKALCLRLLGNQETMQKVKLKNYGRKTENETWGKSNERKKM